MLRQYIEQRFWRGLQDNLAEPRIQADLGGQRFQYSLRLQRLGGEPAHEHAR
jgi:hypothetical protein